MIGGFGQQTCLCRWIGAGATTTGDYQTVSAVLSTAPILEWVGAAGAAGANALAGRLSSDKQNGIFWWFDGRRNWYLIRRVAGVEYTITSGSFSSSSFSLLGSGTTVTLIIGDKPNLAPRKYTVKIGAAILDGLNNFPETGAVS